MQPQSMPGKRTRFKKVERIIRGVFRRKGEVVESDRIRAAAEVAESFDNKKYEAKVKQLKAKAAAETLLRLEAAERARAKRTVTSVGSSTSSTEKKAAAEPPWKKVKTKATAAQTKDGRCTVGANHGRNGPDEQKAGSSRDKGNSRGRRAESAKGRTGKEPWNRKNDWKYQ